MSRLLKVFATLSLMGVAACADYTMTGVTHPAADAAFVAAPGNEDDLTLITGQLPAATQSVSKVIGEEGGTLEIFGGMKDGLPTYHSLDVPAGAVRSPLLFTMTLGSGPYIDVELAAYEIDSRGMADEVGHRGFAKPVYLSLSYAWAVPPVSGDRLEIVYLVGNDRIKERIRTVKSPRHANVVGELHHFSRYAVAVN